LAKAYWNREEASDFKDGWWHSGDLVKVDEDGFYYVVDRKKDMILTGGMNISPREVEDVIAAHSAVNLVSVISVPDEKWGEAVKAIIVLKMGGGYKVLKRELRDRYRRDYFCGNRFKSVIVDRAGIIYMFLFQVHSKDYSIPINLSL